MYILDLHCIDIYHSIYLHSSYLLTVLDRLYNKQSQNNELKHIEMLQRAEGQVIKVCMFVTMNDHFYICFTVYIKMKIKAAFNSPYVLRKQSNKWFMVE